MGRDDSGRLCRHDKYACTLIKCRCDFASSKGRLDGFLLLFFRHEYYRISSEEYALSAEKLSDFELLNLCEKFGREALVARRKFIGLLPEVNKRRLYLQKGFTSIFVFAAVLGGVSEEQVRVALNLKKHFENQPILNHLLVSGAASINKLRRVVSVSKADNQEFWATQVTHLSNRALETLVKDERAQMHVHSNLQQEHLLVKEPTLSLEVKQRLAELQEKGIDINSELLEFLKQRQEKIAVQKEAAAQLEAQRKKPAGRPVSAQIKKIIAAEFGIKCAIETCNKPSQQLHHTSRFSLSRSHNPYYLAPLCRAHHEIAHAVDVKFLERRKIYSRTHHEIAHAVHQKVSEHRQIKNGP